MTKRVYRYFFDFLEGQAAWLNRMAAQGWRLTRCGQLWYDFESCEPGAYEYAVEFVAHKAYGESKDYKAFLEEMGYKTFFKNINVGIVFGSVKWRPWGHGAGQLVTAPGGYFKELIIAEKARDGRPFELHSDLTDALPLYKTIRNACIWTVGSVFALVTMFLCFAVWMLAEGMPGGAVGFALGAALTAVPGVLWLRPTVRIAQRARALKSEAATGEYAPPRTRGRLAGIMIASCLGALVIVGTVLLVSVGGCSTRSGSALMYSGSFGRGHWEAHYKRFDGFERRSVTLEEGVHVFSIDVASESGELTVTITGKNGGEYYRGEALESALTVHLELYAKEKVTLQVDAVKHSGSFSITWD